LIQLGQNVEENIQIGEVSKSP